MADTDPVVVKTAIAASWRRRLFTSLVGTRISHIADKASSPPFMLTNCLPETPDSVTLLAVVETARSLDPFEFGSSRSFMILIGELPDR